MAGDEETYKLNDFIVGNNKLNKSNLNRFYKSYFETACENREIFNDYCPQVANLDTLPPHLWELYRKFERNLKLIWYDGRTVYDSWETDKNALCSYLKYWIYDQLISKDVSQDNFLQFFNLWNARKNEKCPKCKCEFNITSFSEVKELKKTYDYSLFLKAYKRTAKINNKIHYMNYCKYIEDAKAIYSLLGDTCKKKKKNAEYCKEFEEYVLPYINYEESETYEDVEKDEITEVEEDTEEGEDLSGISCNTDLRYDLDAEDSVKLKEALRKIDSLREKKQLNDADETGAQGDIDQEAEAREGDRQHLLPLQKEGSVAHGVLSNGLPQGGDGMINQNLVTNSPENGSPTKTIASASLLIRHLFLIINIRYHLFNFITVYSFLITITMFINVYFLYKNQFSPIRTWLDPRIRKTKSDLKNSVQGSNELQSHDYNFDTTNIDFNRFNVGYQSR
ncbi:hypothetical protein PVIIG_05633 [Plasmodium vivax India VII]|uniref:Uncharacterized protein n=1 Tax=Plasmodium vivax India VII TaxID=1077284 RepID=A0A0J9S546_PLAVI|nr:hypothetical protein PVIIG_05633 [Plasmodium vivax India VII]